MLTVIKFLIFGHLCKWKIIEKGPCSSDSGARWTRYVCQCTECGRIRKFDPGAYL